MTDNENNGLPSLTAEEQAYFDNRGDVPQQEEKPEPVAKAEPEDEDEEIDVVDDDPDAENDDESEEQPLKKVVPLKALHREREAKRALDEKLRAAEADRIRLEERMNMILQQMSPKQAQKPQEEDLPPNDDPIAKIEWLERQLANQQQQTKTIAQQNEERAQFEQLARYAEQHERAFVAQTPDYYEAVEYLKASRAKELQLLGYAQQDINQVLFSETHGIVSAAAQTGRSPAEIAYSIAQQRGWQKKEAALKPAEVKPSTKSLSQASGSATGATISAQDVLRMAPDEFERWISKNPKKYRQLMGG